jgi:hypothetical protein
LFTGFILLQGNYLRLFQNPVGAQTLFAMDKLNYELFLMGGGGIRINNEQLRISN